MKYDKLSREQLIQKIESFDEELKGYVDRIDQRYKIFFERNLAGMYRTRLDGYILDCNDAMAQILGYENKEELIGGNASMLYVEREDRSKNIEILLKDKFVRNQRLALLRKDKAKIWVSISTTLVTHPESEQPEYLEGTVIDITPLINTQHLLTQSEENYRRMIDESPYGVVIQKNGNIRYFNKRAEKILKANLREVDNLSDLFKDKKLLDKGLPEGDEIKHFDRLEVKTEKNSVFIDTYVKNIRFDFEDMTEFSFVDIQDRIKLEEEKIKTGVFKNLNDQLKVEIKEKEEVEKELKSSLEENVKQASKLQGIFENTTHVIWTVNQNFELTSFNHNYADMIERIYGVVPERGDKPMHDYPLNKSKINKRFTEIHKQTLEGESQALIIETPYQDGTMRHMNFFLNPIKDEKGNVIEAAGFANDISDKVKAEKLLTESLKEKEVLLKEIHHRVKNNLQVISSIFNLQSAFTQEPKIRDILKESQNRIKSMAYIHESLYKSSQFGQIDFEAYIKELSKNLIRSYSLRENQISLLADTESVLLDLDVAIPAGLIVNEIISNSLKHAFPNKESGTIGIFLRNGREEVKLKIADDGVGIPDDFDWKNSNTLGIQLVQTLSEQIRANLEVDNDMGTSFNMVFPLH